MTRARRLGRWGAIPAALLAAAVQAADFHVAIDGSNAGGDGSPGNPWATIDYAIDQAASGDRILVGPGTYNGRSRLDREFDPPVTILAEPRYQARLQHDGGAAIVVFTGRNIIVEGFEITHAPNNTGALVVQVQDLLGAFNGSNGGTDPVVSGIVFRDNIIHTSTNNDLLKINNGAEDVLVQGNLFYDQSGSDEHIDINSVIGVTVEDNVFFNTAARPDTSSFIVVKDSNGTSDTVQGVQDVTIRRNVFLNWNGNTGQSFVRFGEDSTAFFETDGAVVENNLMLGNSADRMRTSLTIQGSNDIVVRNNTVVGNLPSSSFAGRLIALGPNPPNANLVLTQNLWSDPTGTMGGEAFNGVDLFDAPAGQTASALLEANLYFNGGNPIPTDAGQALRFADDASPVVGDPLLPDNSALTPPTWNGAQFADGSTTIREVFQRLIENYGTPAAGSEAIDAGDPLLSSPEDILGRPRGGQPDLGAVETNGIDRLFADGFESGR
ncbi:hypothetical protein [Halomonas denitrificans]|nr:hypothetical protein [Halomonas denitrificans]